MIQIMMKLKMLLILLGLSNFIIECINNIQISNKNEY